MIQVTKPTIPPLEEYYTYLQGIWDREHFTNFGPLAIELEQNIKRYLSAKHFYFLSNGTIALQLAIKALEAQGEVITTPFSYVATTSSLVWEGCKPVFADIDPVTLTLDPDSIESKITNRTIAILATHVYGNPCDVKRIKSIADQYGLKVIYDAAHCFGVKYEGTDLVNYGDISTLSFHATKVFHTVEGGGVVTGNDLLGHKLAYFRNFGHNGPEEFLGVGINGKNSELHAAMGLCNLPKIDHFIAARKLLTETYDSFLNAHHCITRPQIRSATEYNFAYYPVILKSEHCLMRVVSILNENGINPRRYFYPCLSQLDYVESQQVPIAEDISRRILCLPLYDSLAQEEVARICLLVLEALEVIAA